MHPFFWKIIANENSPYKNFSEKSRGYFFILHFWLIFLSTKIFNLEKDQEPFFRLARGKA